jgi:metallo-beta-lactamase family protein
LKLTFAGAADTVTGARFLLDTGAQRVLLDCGMFQGFKLLRSRNWGPFPCSPRRVGAVLLSHAHLDHSGMLPALARDGFRGPIHATTATCELAAVMLRDAAHLQEEEADFANRHGFSKHQPAEPLYTVRDAERAIGLLEPVAYDRDIVLGEGLRARFTPTGHLLGAAAITLRRGRASLAFSGDVGRPHDPIMRAPRALEAADTLLVESTYGDRRHDAADPLEQLASMVTKTAARGGIVLMPAFAVGRAQALLYSLWCLKQSGRIPDLPVFLDSPMAIEATSIYRRLRGEHRLTVAQTRGMVQTARMIATPAESKSLADLRVPSVIIAASGMATGGRVLHHLKVLAPDPRNLVLFAGFQAGGTRGAAMVAGAREVKIHGQWVRVEAQVEMLQGLSAHADADELIAWMKQLPKPPRQVYVVHGEPGASDTLRRRIQDELGWPARVPEHLETVDVEL